MPDNEISSFKGKYKFLSNFQACTIHHEGHKYKSVEQAFQAAKCETEADRKKIADTKSPAIAKKVGRKIKMRAEWDQIKANVMLQLLTKKFEDNPDLKSSLLETKPKRLVEGNMWHDMYWGKCMCKKHNGEGKNTLGNLLMEVRDKLD